MKRVLQFAVLFITVAASAAPAPKWQREFAWGRAVQEADPKLAKELHLYITKMPENGLIDLPIRTKVLRANFGERQLEIEPMAVGWRIKGVPREMPEGAFVIAEIEGRPQAIIWPAKQGADGVLVIPAIDADVQGKNARIEKKGANPWNIGYWTDVKDIAVWEANIDKPGKFSVDLEYSLAPNSKGSEIAIEFGDKPIPVKLEAGKDFLDFKTVTVGEIELPAGQVTVTVRPTKKPGLAVMDLRQIVLKPK